MRTISLRLDAESDAMLLALCGRLNATQTDVVRKALEMLASSVRPTPAALGLELGLVGAFASGTRGNAAEHSAAVRARLVQQRHSEQRKPQSVVPHDATNGDAKRRKGARGASKA